MNNPQKIGEISCISGQLVIIDAEILRFIDHKAYIALINNGVAISCDQETYTIYTEKKDAEIEVKISPTTNKVI